MSNQHLRIDYKSIHSKNGILSKFTVKKGVKNSKRTQADSNLPRNLSKPSRKNMHDEKVDQLTSVDINMADVVEDVVMDSDENEDIIPKSTEE